ncbi:MAG: type 2 isopentenyl-diphosphate Delta-isomerase, partial [Porticoccaceae bacterium]
MTDISSRKADHIELALQSEHQSQRGAGFDHVRFEPNPLPQMALDDIDLSSDFLGRKISSPFLIG